MGKSLQYLVGKEIEKPCASGIFNFSKYIAQKCHRPPIGLIFYGSQTKSLDPDGLIDFYLILDRLEDFPQKPLARLGNRVLPPNIYFFKHKEQRAKVAIMTLSQLQKRTQLKSFDTSIWARFSQPVYLIWARDEKARYLLNQEICNAIYTASFWSAVLGPQQGDIKTYLTALYSSTFKTEIRVEKPERISALIERNLNRYKQYLPMAWREVGISFTGKKHFSIRIKKALSTKLQKRWRMIKIWGKIQNALRLLKAAITFNGGADYLRWKVRRHTGIVITLSSYERKYPLIELPMTTLKIIFSFIYRKKV